MQASWNYPTQVVVGGGCTQALPQHCRDKQICAPLVVTDPGLSQTPIVQGILGILRTEGLHAGLFDALKSNPVGGNVESGVACYRQGGFDAIIALGGGSALDTAKAIALMVGQSRPLWDFEDEGDNWKRVSVDGLAPVIAIPTTAGTGSEVGRASVITHEEEQRKVIIFHPSMLPGKVLLDPLLTLGLPAHLTAATGMDALSHCLEAYCADSYHPMAEGIALEGMRLIQKHLPVVYKNGADVASRQQMLVASTMGATAFQRGLGAMHAIAHSLGALFDAHHGLLNAILMPYVLLANRSAIEAKMQRLARYLALPQGGFDSVLDWVLSLRIDLGIPHSLDAIGIDAKWADRIAEMSVKDPSAGGNPVAFSTVQYRCLFMAALEGQLDGLDEKIKVT